MPAAGREGVHLYKHYGRAPCWRAVKKLLETRGATIPENDNVVLEHLIDGQTWIQQIPVAVCYSYRLLYQLLRGQASDDEEAIEKDVVRTVRTPSKGSTAALLLDRSPEHKSTLALAMHHILSAAAMVDHMGYVQGENYVVDVLLKAGVPEEDAFCLFLYALRQLSLFGIYRTDVPILTEYLRAFDERLAALAPDLAAHLEEEGFSSAIYAIEWFTTLFALSARPLLTLAALDLFFGGCRDAALRLALSIMLQIRPQLLQMDQEQLLSNFREVAAGVDETVVAAAALALDMEGDTYAFSAPAAAGGSNAAGSSSSGCASDGNSNGAGGKHASLVRRSRGEEPASTLFRLVAAHSDTPDLREAAATGLLVGRLALQDAALAVTRSLGWDALEAVWLAQSTRCGSDYERHCLANQLLRFAIVHVCHAKAAAFALSIAAADPNGTDAQLCTPLHLCSLFRRPDVARLLLMTGVEAELRGGVRQGAQKLLTPEEMAAEAQSGRFADLTGALHPLVLLLQGRVCLHCNRHLPLRKQVRRCRDCRGAFCASAAPRRRRSSSSQASGNSSGSSSGGSSGGSSSVEDRGQECLQCHPCWARMPSAPLRSDATTATPSPLVRRHKESNDTALSRSSTSGAATSFPQDAQDCGKPSLTNGAGLGIGDGGRGTGEAPDKEDAAAANAKTPTGAADPSQTSAETFPPSSSGPSPQSPMSTGSVPRIRRLSAVGIRRRLSNAAAQEPRPKQQQQQQKSTSPVHAIASATAGIITGSGRDGQRQRPPSPWVTLFMRRKHATSKRIAGGAAADAAGTAAATPAHGPSDDALSHAAGAAAGLGLKVVTLLPPALKMGSRSPSPRSPPSPVQQPPPLAMVSSILGNWPAAPKLDKAADRDLLLQNSAKFVTRWFVGSAWLLIFLAPQLATVTPLAPDECQLGESGRGGGKVAAPEALGLADAGLSLDGVALALGDDLRAFSWRMGPEEGVPWQEAEDAWCCGACGRVFGVLAIRHHCRGCGFCFCDEHAPFSPVFAGGGEVRLCVQCQREMQRATMEEIEAMALQVRRNSAGSVGDAIRSLVTPFHRKEGGTSRPLAEVAEIAGGGGGEREAASVPPGSPVAVASSVLVGLKHGPE